MLDEVAAARRLWEGAILSSAVRGSELMVKDMPTRRPRIEDTAYSQRREVDSPVAAQT